MWYTYRNLPMETKDILQNYYDSIRDKGDIASFFADDMVFITNGRKIEGKANFAPGINGFFSMVQSSEVKEMIISGERASTVVHYNLQAPNGQTFSSDVAEFFSLQDGKFSTFEIYFDSAPYPPR